MNLEENNKTTVDQSNGDMKMEVSIDPIIEKRTSATVIRRRRKKAPAVEEIVPITVDPNEEPTALAADQDETLATNHAAKETDSNQENEADAGEKKIGTEAPDEVEGKLTKEALSKPTDSEPETLENKTVVDEPIIPITKEDTKAATDEKPPVDSNEDAAVDIPPETLSAKDEETAEAVPKEKIIDPITQLKKKLRDETNPARRSFLESQLIATQQMRDKHQATLDIDAGIDDPTANSTPIVEIVATQEELDALAADAPDSSDTPEEAEAKKKRKKLAESKSRKTKLINYEELLAQDAEDSKLIEEEKEDASVYIPTKTVHIPKKGRGRQVRRPFLKSQITKPRAIKTKIKLTRDISVFDLARNMNLKGSEIIKQMVPQGLMLTLNQVIDIDTATLIATEFGMEVENVSFKEDDVFIKEKVTVKEKELRSRPPVITVMGHVDHGKTSLLDCIRQSSVADGEAGGITQHIGAYTVQRNDKALTFIDTPGHEAFSSMRSRGAQCTDIVVLVVAADDGVMPQTVESIAHAKASQVPIIVAINKIDRPEVNLDRIYQELSEKEVISEEWGGDTMFCKVSAKTKVGIEELLDALLLQAEMLELNACYDGFASGVIIEAKVEKGKGTVATVLVREGTLRIGDIVVAGQQMGRVRAMKNHNGEVVAAATPSVPVEITGFSAAPVPGDILNIVSSEKIANELVEHRHAKNLVVPEKKSLTLEELLDQKRDSEEKLQFNIIIKADTRGSLEALKDSLIKLNNPKVNINILHGAVGGINESDVILSATSGTLIIGFNVRAEVKAKDLAVKEGVVILYHSIIYALIDDMKNAIEGRFDPTVVEKDLGRAEVREVFEVTKIGTIAGSSVVDGKITRNCMVRLIRDNVVIYNGRIGSLRRFKDDVKEVTSGYECGLGIERYKDIKVGDVVESYILEEHKTTIY